MINEQIQIQTETQAQAQTHGRCADCIVSPEPIMFK